MSKPISNSAIGSSSLSEMPSATASETVVDLVRTVTFSAAHRYASTSLSREENIKTYGSLYRDEGFGHNFLVEAHFTGSVDPLTGMIANLVDVDQWLRTVAAHFDHQFLNERPEFSNEAPTLERIALSFFDGVNALVSAGVRLKKIRLHEGDHTWVDCSN